MKTLAIILITLAMVSLCAIAGANAYGPALGGDIIAPMFEGYIGVGLPIVWVLVASIIGYAFRLITED